MGSNGAGKSTTMRMALGVISLDSGSVSFDGKPVDSATRRRIGYMPEERGLYGKEKISSQLVFLGQLHGLSGQEAQKSALALLERLGLSSRADDKLDDLSLGNQQRVQLAAALIHDPDLLVLDEPFSGLDPVAVATMTEILQEKAARGVPILFSSHQLDLVQHICSRVGIISKGAMVCEGAVEELRHQGPLRYRIETTARGWYPPESTLIHADSYSVTLEIDGAAHEQKLLKAALEAGEVHGFYRDIPNLAELFKEVVKPS